jgi:hypothetical protein
VEWFEAADSEIDQQAVQAHPNNEMTVILFDRRSEGFAVGA